MARKEKKKDNPEVSIKDKDSETLETMDKTEGEEELSLEEKYEELSKEYQELKDKNLRLYAEFDNYKRRTMREKLDSMKNASQQTLRALLPVLDDFDRAKQSADDEASTEVFTDGVQLVYDKLHKILEQEGLQVMESDHETFDPELHEAVTKAPAPSEELKGKIIHTVEKGYLLNDKILRHAKVVVGN